MSYLTLSTYQIALAAMLPKGAGATAQGLAASTSFPLELVRNELQAMVEAGLLTLDATTGAYRKAGERLS